MPNFSSLAGLEVAEKFLWGGAGGVVCTVIFMSNPPVVLCCVGVGVLTITDILWDKICRLKLPRECSSILKALFKQEMKLFLPLPGLSSKNLLSKPQPQHNTMVGFDMKMTVQNFTFY